MGILYGKDNPEEKLIFITMGRYWKCLLLESQFFKDQEATRWKMGHASQECVWRQLMCRKEFVAIMRMDCAYQRKWFLIGRQSLATNYLRYAKAGNPVSLMVFDRSGRILGEAIYRHRIWNQYSYFGEVFCRIGINDA